MSRYKIIATGSKGNAVLYNDNVLVDCGVPYKTLEPYVKDLKLVLLTHKHSDHINKTTVRKLVYERPTLRFACGEWMADILVECGVKNIDILELNTAYDYGICTVASIELFHDVPNCAWRIYLNDGYKIIHMTDTYTAEGIHAIGYDLYAIERNYDSETIQDIIAEKKILGKFAYEEGAINSHLSFQQAQAFFDENKKEDSELIRLHESSRYKQNGGTK